MIRMSNQSGATPKVSVCVPTYNRAALLPNFLRSVFQQTFVDYEVIVADNCSTDDTPRIVTSIADSRIRYHRHEENIGPFANMNWLIDRARGEYVCILHDDDVYFAGFLARLAEILDRHRNVGMVHCAAYEVDARGRRRQTVRAYRTTRVMSGKDEFVRYLQGHNVCCSSVMARTDLFKANPFDKRFLCADFLMWMKFALSADVAYVAEPLLEMRVHHDSVTGWLHPMRWHDEFIAILEEGFSLGARRYPELAASRAALFRSAGRAQGRRFLIAGLGAVAQGDFELARSYADVLDKLGALDLPTTYPRAARLLSNRLGQTVLHAVALLRRFLAGRGAASSPVAGV